MRRRCGHDSLERFMRCDSVILAAGLGTRMRSDRPKVMHPLGGKPLVCWAVEAAAAAVGQPPVVVIGPGETLVQSALPAGVRFVVQEDRLGTGHAARQAERVLRGTSDVVLVTSADMPLLRPETLRAMVESQQHSRAALTLLTVRAGEARGFGRVVRGESGRILAIVEEADATPDQMAIREFNVGAYVFQAGWLWDHLALLPRSRKGEYYLTDLVGMAVSEGALVEGTDIMDEDEVIGVNTREHLAQAEAALRRTINRRWMLEGVTLQDPATSYIGPDVVIGKDTTILANTHLEGKTVIGERCVIGPGSILRDSTVGDGCSIELAVVEEAVLEDGVDIGPYAHLRPGAHLMRGVHMGNFGEVKASTLGPGVKMGHFSYIGDADVGANTNIGAGTITCNFSRDGKKNHTQIGQGAFIGSDTMLVAPVTIGDGAVTGAGAVVTHDVPADSLAIGLPARVIRKLKGDA
jgi:bifunctional UDP-N-acetylglucosamine pyrophosphorylase/glucosamine-1-phosphate N-acetyltransferase